jgi:nicotinamide-nucleotide amidase
MDLPQLAARVGEILLARQETLVCVESCTGGWIAKTLTDIPGSSAWFERGFVTYSNAAKQEMVGVDPETLHDYGAVSEAVAREMAIGGLGRSPASWAVAVSGIAGPGGGSPDKPVGMVCFAWARRNGFSQTLTEHFSGSREAVRYASVQLALSELLALFSRHD